MMIFVLLERGWPCLTDPTIGTAGRNNGRDAV